LEENPRQNTYGFTWRLTSGTHLGEFPLSIPLFGSPCPSCFTALAEPQLGPSLDTWTGRQHCIPIVGHPWRIPLCLTHLENSLGAALGKLINWDHPREPSYLITRVKHFADPLKTRFLDANCEPTWGAPFRHHFEIASFASRWTSHWVTKYGCLTRGTFLVTSWQNRTGGSHMWNTHRQPLLGALVGTNFGDPTWWNT
jgi:hypothetical protein